MGDRFSGGEGAGVLARESGGGEWARVVVGVRGRGLSAVLAVGDYNQ